MKCFLDTCVKCQLSTWMCECGDQRSGYVWIRIFERYHIDGSDETG